MRSPCTRHCSINEKQLCVGCGRTRGEITQWRNMTEEEKYQAIAEEIAEWHGNTTPAPQPVLQTLHEAPVVETVVEPELVSFHYDSEIGEDVDNEEE